MMVQESCEIGETRSKERNETQEENFAELLTEAVDNVFSLLGESCKRSLYLRLRISYNIDKKEIPQRIDDFADALEAIFDLGAKLIEIEIMKSLFNKVQTFIYSPKKQDLSFTNYVKKLCSL